MNSSNYRSAALPICFPDKQTSAVGQLILERREQDLFRYLILFSHLLWQFQGALMVGYELLYMLLRVENLASDLNIANSVFSAKIPDCRAAEAQRSTKVRLC